MTRFEGIRLAVAMTGSVLVTYLVTRKVLTAKYEADLARELEVAKIVSDVPSLSDPLPDTPITEEYAQQLLNLAYAASPEVMEKAVMANLLREEQYVPESTQLEEADRDAEELDKRFRRPKTQEVKTVVVVDANGEPEGIVRVTEKQLRMGPTYGDYDDVTYVWYAGDNVLTNEREEPTFAANLLVGPLDELKLTPENPTIYIINHDLSLNIEVCYDPGSYGEDDEETELRHDARPPLRKFRPDRD